MNADLRWGAAEGSYKTLVRDRGGVVESHASEMRKYADDVWHGFHQADSFDVPGVCVKIPPLYPMPQGPIDMDRW